MWPRMLVLTVLVALLAGGAPSAAAPAAAAHPAGSRGHADIPRAAHVRGHADVPHAVRGSWSWPLAPPHAIARPYLAPPTPYAAGHRGIDIRGPVGSNVLAPDDGVVHFAGFVVDRPVLSLAHEGRVLSSFEPVQTTLVAGDAVARGQIIGTLESGHCSTPCLHLGARVDGEYVNPLLFLGGVPWSVLLPRG